MDDGTLIAPGQHTSHNPHLARFFNSTRPPVAYLLVTKHPVRCLDLLWGWILLSSFWFLLELALSSKVWSTDQMLVGYRATPTDAVPYLPSR